MLQWLKTYGTPLLGFIRDTTAVLGEAIKAGKNIMFEAQLGALRDIDFGIFPYTTSSSALAAYAPIGSGIPGAKLDEVIGIMKAYSTCVGEGPFTCELFGDEAAALREAGCEYGAATGRPRRVGGFDAVASRYGCMMHGADCLALTKLDVLSYMERIPVCTAYTINGKTVRDFPSGKPLVDAKPVYEYLDGWLCDISSCRIKKELPAAALDYIRFIADAVGCPVRYVSVGASREQYIRMF
jgi:adenylosuccinate synthase